MPGFLTFLNQKKVGGFAVHPFLPEYPVVIHVIQKTRIIYSQIADQAPTAKEDEQSNNWFYINLSESSLSEADLRHLVFLIGESDELLDRRRLIGNAESAQTTELRVEDLLYTNANRRWVTGATYIEAVQAGMSDADVIDLFYRDILGRPSDPDGLANYLFQRQEGIRSFEDIRKSLYDSDEYRNRKKEVAWAPGAIFSQSIALLPGSAALELEDRLDARIGAGAESSPSTEAAPIPWPSYPERQIPPKIRGSSETIELVLPVDSVLFGAGWHSIEYLEDISFRWMETVGTIFSPKPDMPCLRIVLKLGAVYGAHLPMLDCYLDERAASVEIDSTSLGFLVVVTPASGGSQTFTKLRIESRVSGCPLREDKGTDDRTLSLNLLGVVITYLSV